MSLWCEIIRINFFFSFSLSSRQNHSKKKFLILFVFVYRRAKKLYPKKYIIFSTLVPLYEPYEWASALFLFLETHHLPFSLPTTYSLSLLIQCVTNIKWIFVSSTSMGFFFVLLLSPCVFFSVRWMMMIYERE